MEAVGESGRRGGGSRAAGTGVRGREAAGSAGPVPAQSASGPLRRSRGAQTAQTVVALASFALLAALSAAAGM
ncbi:hypothetical protein ACFQZ2_22490, partial [Streptomonospora algeriensis]